MKKLASFIISLALILIIAGSAYAERCRRIEQIQGNENLFVKKACQSKGLW